MKFAIGLNMLAIGVLTTLALLAPKVPKRLPPIKEPVRSQFILECMVEMKAPATFCICLDRHIDGTNLDTFAANRETIIPSCVAETKENISNQKGE